MEETTMQKKVREAEVLEEEEIIQKASMEGICIGEFIPGTLVEKYTREQIICEYGESGMNHTSQGGMGEDTTIHPTAKCCKKYSTYCAYP